MKNVRHQVLPSQNRLLVESFFRISSMPFLLGNSLFFEVLLLVYFTDLLCFQIFSCPCLVLPAVNDEAAESFY